MGLGLLGVLLVGEHFGGDGVVHFDLARGWVLETGVDGLGDVVGVLVVLVVLVCFHVGG